MTQEEKLLLTKDLCARLPYRVKCYVPIENCTMELTGKRLNYFCFHKDVWGFDYSHEFEIVLDPLNDAHNGYIIKPYLRPLSSMTEEESKELQKITNNNFYASSNYISNSNSSLDGEWRSSYNNFVTNDICNKLISWLDKNHFDHRTDEEGKTLIEKGLAIPVTKENNPYKTLKV